MIFCAMTVSLCLISCTDDDTIATGREQALNGIGLSINVTEQADLIYDLGHTRAATTADSTRLRAYTPAVHPLEGSTDLYIHRMPLPYFGIHPRTVHGTTADSTATRAPLSEIAGNGIAFHDSLTIWGFTNGRSGEDVTLFNGTLVQKINGFRTASEWPYADAGTMHFYAIAPALESMEEFITITNKASISYSTSPTFTYTVPDDPAAQRDLVYGTSPDINIETKSHTTDIGQDNKEVPMTFTHLLTAVRFAQGKMPVGFKIKELSLTGINHTGTYTSSTGNWTDLSGSKNYTISTAWTSAHYEDYTGQTVNGHTYVSGENVYIDGGNVLFLMPQTVPAGTKLTVKLNTGVGADRTLSCDISGDTWAKGSTVTYKITVGKVADDYYLLVGAAPGVASETKDHEGTSASNQTFTVHSYRMYQNYESSSSGTEDPSPIRWKVSKYSTDGSTYTTDKPSTLNWLTINGAGSYQTGGSNQSLTYSLLAQSPAYILDHKYILNNNNIGSASSLDLSCYRPNGNGNPARLYPSANTDGSTKQPYQTANCYIVNCAGSYCFPLVYGNAYEGSTTAKTGSALNPSDIFKDHANRTITYGNIIDQVNNTVSKDVKEPADADDISMDATATNALVTTEIIYNNARADYKAELVWQDVSGQFVITDPGIVQEPVKGTSPGYIGFTVTANPAPGNCVIAFKGKKTIKKTRKLYNGDTDLGKTRTTTDTSSDFETLWTWHIWCTDEVLPNNSTTEISAQSGSVEPKKQVDLLYPSYDATNSTKIPQIQNYAGTSNSIMPVNLGWVPNPDGSGNYLTNIYRQRKAWVELEQEAPGNQTAHVIIEQDWVPDIVAGTSTIYQWGRPTALPMLRKYDGSTNGALRDVFDGASTPSTITSRFDIKNITHIGDITLYPDKIVRCASETRWWEDASNYAFWSSTKTIYDPCPSGYQLPSVNIFKGFSMIDGNSSTAADLNMWTGTTSGVRFYEPQKGGFMYATKHTSITADDRYGTMVFVPTLGIWSGDNAEGTSMSTVYDTDKYMQKDLSIGYYWTFEISSFLGTILDIQPDRGSGHVNFNTTKYPIDALPIRPVKTTTP